MKLQLFAAASGLFAVLSGSIVLAWYFNKIYFLNEDYFPMKSNTAVGFILLGIALLFHSRIFGARRIEVILTGGALALAAMLLAFVTSLQDLLGLSLGIDSLFFQPKGEVYELGATGRMSPVTSFSLFALGSALLLNLSLVKAAKAIAQTLALFVFVIAGFVLIGYLYKTDLGYQIGQFTRITGLSSTLFLILSAGILSLTREVGFVSILFRTSYGGFVARRLIFTVLFAIPFLGWIQHTLSEGGYITDSTGVALLVISTIVAVCPLILSTARKLDHLQNALARRQQMFRYLVEGTQDHAIFMLDLRGRIQSWNSGAERVTGYSEKQVVRESLSILFHESDRNSERLHQFLSSALSQNKFKQEVKLARQDGRSLTALLTLSRVQTEVGRAIGFACVTQDITAAKEAEEKILRSEAQFRTLANSIPQMAWMTDESGAITWYNDKWYDYTGTRDGEMKGWGWMAVHHSEHLERVVSRFRQSLENKTSWQDTFPLRSASGEWRWFLSMANPVFDEGGHVLSWVGTNTDITDERNSKIEREALLKELEEKSGLLETVMEQMPAAVIIAKAPSGKILYGNDQVEKVWRHPVRPAEEIKDYSKWIGFHSDGRQYEGQDWPLARAITKGEIVLREDTDVLRGDGSRGVICLSAAPVRNTRGEIVAGVVICEDVTEARQFESQLLRTKEAAEAASVAKTQFLANMSHEIRTPMNAVIGFSDLLLEKNLSEAEKKEYLRRIRSAGAHLVKIIDDILDFSRVDSGRMQIEKVRFSVLDIIHEVFDALGTAADGKGIQFQVQEMNSIPPQIHSDPSRLRQILLNLVGNAVKFTDKGAVTVRLQFLEKSASRNENELAVEIEDTGIGIPYEAQGQLFQLFRQADSSVTRRYGGTGLGLALSKRLVQALGGDLILKKSHPQKGSIFRFTIPTGQVAQNRTQEDSQKKIEEALARHVEVKPSAQLKGKKILLAEDSPDNVILMRVYLESEGARIDHAHDGLEAIKMAVEHDYDLVLMDLQMPNLDGLEATRQLRHKNYSKPILAVTAHALKEEVIKSLEAGCNDHITKPVKRKDLVDAIVKIAGRGA